MFATYSQYLFFVPLLLFTFNLSANAFLPTFMFVWPLAWLLFIPIVFIEAFVMRKFLKQESFIKLLLLNTLSNALSTFMGIPIIFFLYALLFLFPANVFTFNEYWKALWILITLGSLSLFPLFFFVSVWIEKWVLKKKLHTKYDELTITKAVKQANIASYIFLFIAYIIVWIGSFYYPTVFRIFSIFGL